VLNSDQQPEEHYLCCLFIAKGKYGQRKVRGNKRKVRGNRRKVRGNKRKVGGNNLSWIDALQ
jgi:hypothetical protein